MYELAVLGNPTPEQLGDFKDRLKEAADQLQLLIGKDIGLALQPASFSPSTRSAAAAVFFGGTGTSSIDIGKILDIKNVPILPVYSTRGAMAKEIPSALQSLNCIAYDQVGAFRVFSALLECVGLLPRQRRVFLSYRRNEAMPAAVQLFAELSARQFDVFLDTHRIAPAVQFQEVLWHQLCDVDVLVMLETKSYFASRWTSAEFGRALAKGIGLLRVQWPDSTPSPHTETASRVELVPADIDASGQLATSAIQRICNQLEQVRCLAHATRHLSLVSSVQAAIELIDGRVDAIGAYRLMHLTFRSGRQLIVQPTIGVPTAVTLHEAMSRAGSTEAAVVYDHLGILKTWEDHLTWLATNVKGARWVKSSDVAWDFAGWEV
jgi:hypothetical protein